MGCPSETEWYICVRVTESLFIQSKLFKKIYLDPYTLLVLSKQSV